MDPQQFIVPPSVKLEDAMLREVRIVVKARDLQSAQDQLAGLERLILSCPGAETS